MVRIRDLSIIKGIKFRNILMIVTVRAFVVVVLTAILLSYLKNKQNLSEIGSDSIFRCKIGKGGERPKLNGTLQTFLCEDGCTFSFGRAVFDFGHETIGEIQKIKILMTSGLKK